MSEENKKTAPQKDTTGQFEDTKTTNAAGPILETTEKVIENVKELASDIAEGVEDVKKAVKKTTKKAKAAIDEKVDVAGDAVTTVKKKAAKTKKVVENAVVEVVAKAEGVTNETKKGAKEVTKNVRLKLVDALETIKGKAEDVADAIEDKTEDIVDSIEDKYEDIVDTIKDKAKNITDQADKKTKKVAKEVKEKIANVVEAVKEKAEKVEDAAQNVVKDVIAGTKDVVADLKNAASLVVEEFSKDEKSSEPSGQKAIVLNDEYLADLSSKTLKEILQVLQELIDRGDQHEMYKYTESIKTSFYKALKREKIAIGFTATVEGEVVDSEVSSNPFAEVERGFKELYSRYKSSRSAYVQDMERKKDENLKAKLQIIEELKLLLEKQEDINKTFPEFRVLQSRWRDSGAVPQAKVKDVYDTYQHYVEMFYDYVKINNEFRDLDFKKNLEAKIVLCEQAEALVEEDNVINAFARLQKLHEEWKENGPVEKEHREKIWDRFKLATSEINKKHHTHFEGVKDVQKDNYAAKVLLCERAEEVSVKEIPDSNSWNVASKELTNLQQEWKTVGFASKKDNQKIYDRFRAACDNFYDRKREYYSSFKDQMTQNTEKKTALCEQAEALKDSIDWAKTTDKFIHLQKVWKETGPVSRKKSDQIWNRFRAACDHFFDNKEKNFGGVDPEYVVNLEKKQAIIEEIKSYTLSNDHSVNVNIMRGFITRWNELGFVPFKEKERIQGQFKAAMEVNFPDYKSSGNDRGQDRGGFRRKGGRPGAPVFSERDKLIQQFRKKESEISTYENNIGFFASSKNADAFIQEFVKKIETAKQELAELENKIKSIEKQSE